MEIVENTISFLFFILFFTKLYNYVIIMSTNKVSVI
nr:MAG TPA: hypothetical protein [Caudoviricetes sp.]